MDEAPETFTVIQLHLSDDYETPFCRPRADFYGVAYLPTVWFNGTEEYIGGPYSYYRDCYEWYITQPTDVWIEVGGEHVAGQTYLISARVGIDPDGQAKTVRVFVAHVLDNYPEASDDRYRNCLRGPTPAYQDFSLQPGESALIEREFPFDETSWARQGDIKIIVWAQDPPVDGPPKEVYNARSMRWPFGPLDPYELGDLNCDGSVDGFDIDAFVLAITSAPSFDDYYAVYPDCNHMLADCNEDGSVDGFDIDAFVELLTS